jgi:hypothetical protein
MFPEELPKRIIRMFTFIGETVLDPFLGSGTTVKVALELNRNSIGYEINEKFLEVIKKKVEINSLDMVNKRTEIIKRNDTIIPYTIDYIPRIKDAKPVIEPDKLKFGKNEMYKIVDVLDDGKLKLDTNIIVKLKGILIINLEETKSYLKKYILGKKVYLKFDKGYVANEHFVEAYVYLKNKIFINAYLIKTGLAITDKNAEFDLKKRFMELENNFQNIITETDNVSKGKTEVAEWEDYSWNLK